ncbi:hypothetical protein GCM10022206_75440 [Streptomyces chiangmaiensis]
MPDDGQWQYPGRAQPHPRGQPHGRIAGRLPVVPARNRTHFLAPALAVPYRRRPPIVTAGAKSPTALPTTVAAPSGFACRGVRWDETDRSGTHCPCSMNI